VRRAAYKSPAGRRKQPAWRAGSWHRFLERYNLATLVLDWFIGSLTLGARTSRPHSVRSTLYLVQTDTVRASPLSRSLRTERPRSPAFACATIPMQGLICFGLNPMKRPPHLRKKMAAHYLWAAVRPFHERNFLAPSSAIRIRSFTRPISRAALLCNRACRSLSARR